MKHVIRILFFILAFCTLLSISGRTQDESPRVEYSLHKESKITIVDAIALWPTLYPSGSCNRVITYSYKDRPLKALLTVSRYTKVLWSSDKLVALIDQPDGANTSVWIISSDGTSADLRQIELASARKSVEDKIDYLISDADNKRFPLSREMIVSAQWESSNKISGRLLYGRAGHEFIVKFSAIIAEGTEDITPTIEAITPTDILK